MKGNPIEGLSHANFTHLENCEQFELLLQSDAKCELKVHDAFVPTYCVSGEVPGWYCSVSMVCSTVGSHGRSWDQEFRNDLFRSENRACPNKRFDEIASEITALRAENPQGNITISQNGLAGLRKLKIFEIDNYRTIDAPYYLDIPPNEFQNAPNVSLFNVMQVHLTENAVQAISKLKNTLTYVKFSSSKPQEKILDLVKSLTKLEYVTLAKGSFENTPGTLFVKSAATLKSIVFFEWNGKIPADIFKGLRNLEELTWYYSNITEIQPGAFDDLVELKTLQLHNNRMRRLPDGIFSKLKKLAVVNLEGNRIENVSRQNFTHVENYDGFRFSM